jgi:prepilin-type N-terminal cleavage/methylation domain-containing protein
MISLGKFRHNKYVFLTKQSGFTLTEVLLSASIISVLALVGTTMVRDVYKLWSLDEARLESQRDARNVLGLISPLLKSSSAASVLVTRLNSSEPLYSKIQFTTTAGDTYAFYQQAGTVKMNKVPASGTPSTTLVAKKLRTMQFSYPISTQQNLINAVICFEVPIYQGQVKDFYMTLQQMKIENP